MSAEEIDPTLQVTVKIAIVDKNGEHKCQQESVLKAGTIKDKTGFPPLVSTKDLFDPKLKLLNNNQLEIFCELRFQYNGDQEPIITKQLAHILSNDFSDITLVVGDHKIQSHKFVLAGKFQQSLVYCSQLQILILQRPAKYFTTH